MIKRFEHVGLITKNIESMIDFYTNLMDFKLINKFEIDSDYFKTGVKIPDAKATVAYLNLENSDFIIEVFQYNSQYDRIEELSESNYPGYRHLAFVVDDINIYYNKLKSRGLIFNSEPLRVLEPERKINAKFVYFKDPEGNIIELIENVE